MTLWKKNFLTIKMKQPPKTSFKERQNAFIKKVNVLGKELNVVFEARLRYSEMGVIPMIYIVDALKKDDKPIITDTKIKTSK